MCRCCRWWQQSWLMAFHALPRSYARVPCCVPCIFLKHRSSRQYFVYRHVYVYSCIWAFFFSSSSSATSTSCAFSYFYFGLFILQIAWRTFCWLKQKAETIKATATPTAAKQNRWTKEMATISHKLNFFFLLVVGFICFFFFVVRKSDWLGLLVIIMQWNDDDNDDNGDEQGEKMKIHCVE